MVRKEIWCSELCYETISETEVALTKAHNASGRTEIPSEVTDKDGNKYKVVAVGKRLLNYEYEHQPEDRRRKPEIRSSSTYLAAFETYVSNHGNFGVSNVTEVILPDTIRTLCPRAFHGSKLTEIKLPTAIEEIPESCFQSCWKLKSIQLPQGLKVIGRCAFHYTEFEEVIIPSSVTHIREFAFRNPVQCSQYTKNVYILNDESNVIVDPNAFNSNTNVKYLGVPKLIKDKSEKSKGSLSVESEPQSESKRIKVSVVESYGYKITKNEDKSFTITHNGELCSNAKAAMRELAKDLGFEYDAKWNTQQFGTKLMQFILKENVGKSVRLIKDIE